MKPWADYHPNNKPYSAPIFHLYRQPFFPFKIRQKEKAQYRVFFLNDLGT